VPRGKEVLTLEANGPVVGLVPHTQYGQSPLPPRYIPLAYTDGIKR